MEGYLSVMLVILAHSYLKRTALSTRLLLIKHLPELMNGNVSLIKTAGSLARMGSTEWMANLLSVVLSVIGTSRSSS